MCLCRALCASFVCADNFMFVCGWRNLLSVGSVLCVCVCGAGDDVLHMCIVCVMGRGACVCGECCVCVGWVVEIVGYHSISTKYRSHSSSGNTIKLGNNLSPDLSNNRQELG